MSRKKVLVLGANFGGLTAALAVNHELHGDVDVRVISASDRFLFNPSLIWLPFGKRSPRTSRSRWRRRSRSTGSSSCTRTPPASTWPRRRSPRDSTAATLRLPGYDYLSSRPATATTSTSCPGSARTATPYTITTLDDAIHAGEGWRRFLDNPGDIVVGASQGAGCFGAAYEFLFNMSYQLRKAGLKKQVKLTYVTAEPFLGHFGIGGLPHGETLLGDVPEEGAHHRDRERRHGPRRRGRLVARRREEHRLRLRDDRPAVHRAGGRPLGRADRRREGLREGPRHLPGREYDDVYAVGIAAAVDVPWQTADPGRRPQDGLPDRVQAHVAARNIAAQIRGEQPRAHEAFGDIPAVCVMDAGNNGVIILADKMLPPRKHGVLIPGPQAHAMKLGFEKYFLWKARHGYVTLP